MKLSKSAKDQWYTIESIEHQNEDLVSRFQKLGIFPGAQIMLKRKAPLFKDPLLFLVNDSLIALTKSEAACVEIRG